MNEQRSLDERIVVIEAALNGGRDRAEQPAVPHTAAELATEARRCAAAGATLVHVHARDEDGGWTADLARYAAAVRAIREAVPNVLISLTSLRPEGVPVEAILDLLDALAADAATRPDLISVNLGHIAVWGLVPGGQGRRTVHYPNGYEDVTRLLAACAPYGVRPELGIMDLGFVSNAVALRDDDLLPDDAWFLLELDSPAYGAGPRVAPATVANYDALAAAMRDQFPAARWAAHGQGIAGYAVIARALADGAHVRVGFEDAVCLPDGHLARSNAELVAWAVAAARERGREPASLLETRAITGCR
jgi:3-keto-5-aminohexanoate cleavage enzyme